MDSPSLGPKWQIKSCQINDNISIRYGLFTPHDGPLTHVLIHMNGRGEWIEKLADLPESIDLPSGWAFLTWDHRGQGASDGARAHIASFDDFVFDAQKVISEAIGSTPYSITCHSMGGLIAIYGTVKGCFNPQQIISSAPLLGLPNHPIPAIIAGPLAQALSVIGFSKVSSGGGRHEKSAFECNDLTHDTYVYQKVCNSPYPIPGASFGWINAAWHATKYIFKPEHLKKLTTPVTILAAEEETVVNPSAQVKWCELAKKHAKANINYHLIKGARHELFSEDAKFRDQAIEIAREKLFSSM